MTDLSQRRTVALEVTADCPRSCLYCYNSWKARPPATRELPSGGHLGPVVEAALASKRFSRVDLTGGEPLSSPALFDVIDDIRRFGAVTTLVTDGALLGRSEALDLRRREVALVQLTVLSTDRTVHAQLKGDDTLGATIHAAALLAREDVPVSLAFICTKLNHDHFEEVLRLARALGVKSVAFSRLCAAGEALHHRAELWPEPHLIAAILDRLPELGQRHRVEVLNSVAVPHCVSPAGGRCGLVSGRPNFTIDTAGRVRPCSVSPTVLGNLMVEGWPVIEARYLALLREIRAAVPEPCRSCDRLDQCGGGCYESAIAGGGGSDPLIPT